MYSRKLSFILIFALFVTGLKSSDPVKLGKLSKAFEYFFQMWRGSDLGFFYTAVSILFIVGVTCGWKEAKEMFLGRSDLLHTFGGVLIGLPVGTIAGIISVTKSIRLQESEKDLSAKIQELKKFFEDNKLLDQFELEAQLAL
ncbi:hypothetical protein KAW80_02995 [Candidatus Babeliales bacterium]|nr:hypothetical protein [Candidatus Babeliales bacterium]